MYPAKPKVVYTPQGRWLRGMITMSALLDYCFFVFALALVGFKPMLADMILAFWGYSVYLTLREWSIILYCIFKIVAAFGLCFGQGDTYGGQYANTQIFGIIINAGFHVLSAYYVGRAYYFFRKNGGIHGTGATNIPGSKQAEKA